MFRTRIEKLVPGGEGFGRLEDGKPVFVPDAFPGDVVGIERATHKKQFARAEEHRLLEASALRRAPPCSIHERCGGCDWMPLSEAAQHEHKLSLLREALRRTGRFKEEFPIAVRAFGSPLHYRQRVRLHFDEQGQMGFHARHTHEVVPAAACQVVAPELALAIAELEACRAEDAASFAAFTDVEVRALGEQRSLAFTLRRGRRANPALLARLGRSSLVSLSAPAAPRSELATKAPLERWPSHGGVYLLAAPGSFTQVNWSVNRAIVEELVNGALQRGVGSFLDLYCGVGNFALPLFAAGFSGLGLDDDARAIQSAQRAAAEQGFQDAAFEHRDVGQWLSAAPRGAYDLVVIDPPRAGLQGDVASVARLCRGTLFLCSCDPVTFARDLRRLVDLGFAVESVALYDMFPQTHHFEVVCWLKR